MRTVRLTGTDVLIKTGSPHLEVPLNHRRSTVIALSALLAATFAPVVTSTSAFAAPLPAFAAAEPNQVTDLTVRQADGFATLAWTPVDGRHRLPDRAHRRSTPTARPPAQPAIAGVWRPNRQVNNESPTFADAGFNPGDRFQWRVRARIGTAEQPLLGPGARRHHARRGATRPSPARTCVPSGRPPRPRSTPATSTSTPTPRPIDALSDRVRVVEIGRTVLNRPDQHVRHRLPDPAGHPGGGRRHLAAGRSTATCTATSPATARPA